MSKKAAKFMPLEQLHENRTKTKQICIDHTKLIHRPDVRILGASMANASYASPEPNQADLYC